MSGQAESEQLQNFHERLNKWVSGLAEAYPGRDSAGRILMDIPLEGVLYDLTQKQADEIYEKGARCPLTNRKSTVAQRC